MANLLAVCSQNNATFIACNTPFLILGRSVRSPQVTQAVEGDMISNSPASISAPMLPITRRLVACQRNTMIGSHVRHLLKVGGHAGPDGQSFNQKMLLYSTSAILHFCLCLTVVHNCRFQIKHYLFCILQATMTNLHRAQICSKLQPKRQHCTAVSSSNGCLWQLPIAFTTLH